MRANSTDFTLVTFVSLLLLLLTSEGLASSKQFQAAVYNTTKNNRWICHDGFMTIYISKAQFAGLPFTIYVQDVHSGYYQVISVAKQCHYFLGETNTFIIFTAASHGCFVRRHKYTTNLTVAILALAGRGGVEIVESFPLICERKTKEGAKIDYMLVARHFSCGKDGFHVTIPRYATVPPLNPDTVWIPAAQSHNCKPKNTSKDAVTFSFPFTDCGTQSMTADGIITYWVDIEVKQHLQRGSIFRDAPFLLHMRCYFALAKMTHLGIVVQGEKSLFILKSEGTLRTEMRFARDSSYTSFYSSRDPPTVTELGQSVHVEVFVLKREDKDLMLLLDDCWATPTKNPHDPQRWSLLVKGCPFSGDSHRTVVLPVVSSKELKYPSLHKWFVVKMFAFVKPSTFDNLVYFHCDVEICKGPGCSHSCSDGRRQFRRITPEPGERILYSVVSGGPLLLLL